jgi:hypothetical protein
MTGLLVIDRLIILKTRGLGRKRLENWPGWRAFLLQGTEMTKAFQARFGGGRLSASDPTTSMLQT